MSLIVATGTNIGNLSKNLADAKSFLCEHFELIKESRIYKSAPVGVTDQDDFYNQVLEFKLPHLSPEQVLDIILKTELNMGRVRTKKWGPRIIDIDIIFWDMEEISQPNLNIPHPHWAERSFVVKPLMELPFFNKIKNNFNVNSKFEIDAWPLNIEDKL